MKKGYEASKSFKSATCNMYEISIVHHRSKYAYQILFKKTIKDIIKTNNNNHKNKKYWKHKKGALLGISLIGL